ncbi:unnamed protein product [Leptosia nina]|uniref:Uncharacterized protein n=1 Tax=Leptosia nina TaxID=320188 RepID=A0AAV1JUT8_9NEOP
MREDKEITFIENTFIIIAFVLIATQCGAEAGRVKRDSSDSDDSQSDENGSSSSSSDSLADVDREPKHGHNNKGYYYWHPIWSYGGNTTSKVIKYDTKNVTDEPTTEMTAPSGDKGNDNTSLGEDKKGDDKDGNKKGVILQSNLVIIIACIILVQHETGANMIKKDEPHESLEDADTTPDDDEYDGYTSTVGETDDDKPEDASVPRLIVLICCISAIVARPDNYDAILSQRQNNILNKPQKVGPNVSANAVAAEESNVNNIGQNVLTGSGGLRKLRPQIVKDWPYDLLIVMAKARRIGNQIRLNSKVMISVGSLEPSE